MPSDPYFDSPDFAEFARSVREDLIPKIDGSAVTLSLVPKDPSALDVKYAVELAFCILLDKPLVLLVAPGQVLPEHLVRVADSIVEVDLKDPASAGPRIQAAMAELLP